MRQEHYVHRDLDWLNFNGRVLEESADEHLPIYERIKFMAIFSANLDEYYRVKLAALHKLKYLKKKRIEKWLTFNPQSLISKIGMIVNEQQEHFGYLWRQQILPELAKNSIILIEDEHYHDEHREAVSDHFQTAILSYLSVQVLTPEKKVRIENGCVYLAIHLKSKITHQESTGLIKIPSELPRFIQLPIRESKYYITFLDDIIRANIPLIFPDYVPADSSYSIKINYDEDVEIEDEFRGNLLTKIKEQLEKRKLGVPVRLLFDAAMPENLLQRIVSASNIETNNLVKGGRYHNLNDLLDLPNPVGQKLEAKKIIPLKVECLEGDISIASAMKKRDFLLHYPYHTYEYALRFFSEAIFDSSVIKIQITLYRISRNSLIAQSLIAAAKNGKEVVVFVEVKARYDELNNILWANEMEKAGVQIIYSIPKLKVHAKVALITRLEKGNKKVRYAYLATGNFNERTARIYADYGLLTINKNITRELNLLFDYLVTRKTKSIEYKTLLVSRFSMKKKLLQLIDREIAASKRGLPAKIHLKMNSMDEVEMIEKLYEASQQGVEVKLIVRAGCSLIPGIPGISENISAYRIVDRYLEHARIYYFYQGGKEPVYLSSADWMNRNLNKRIEVAFPVLDKKCKAQIRHALDLQLSDNTKRTSIQQSERIMPGTKPVRAQTDTYTWLKNLEKLSMATPSTHP